MVKTAEFMGYKPANITPWVRNPSWSSLPSVSDTEQKLVGLRAIWPNDDNFCSFTVAGPYHVDWGDGTSEDVASGIQAYHTYNWSDTDLDNTNAPVTFTDSTDLVSRTAHGYADDMTISFASITSTTGITVGQIYYVINATADTFQVASSRGGAALALTTNGSGWILPYKQAVVTITPQGLNSLTSIELDKKHFQSGLLIYESGWLDIVVSGPNLTVLTVSTSLAIRFSLLEQFRLISTNSISTLYACFSQAHSLRSVSLKTSSSLTSTSYLFANCYSLQSIPLFDTSSVTTMSSMFTNCYSLQIVPQLDMSSVSLTAQMFSGCYSLQEIPFFNTGSVTRMDSIFKNCYSLKYVPPLDTSSVTNMSYMFNACYSLREVPLLNTSQVSSMGNMFRDCYNLRSVPLFDTSSATDMSYMFTNCTSLQSVPLFNTSLANTMLAMFSNCYSLRSVPLFDTSSVASMQSTFASCHSLKSIPLLDTSSVTTMYGMFSYCHSLQTIPLFNTTLVSNISNMFQYCAALTNIPALSFSAVILCSTAFSSCTSLSRFQVTGFGTTFSVAFCKLSAAALDEIYTNLPTVASETITVTGNYGTASDTPSIATAKGWTVTG